MGAVYLRKYNVTLASATAGSTKIRLSLRKAGVATFATGSDWTPASGEVKVSKDGGSEANITTLPAYSNGQWEFVLSGTELSAMEVHVRISASAVDDEDFVVETFGNASAMYPGDYVDGVRNGIGTALPNAAAAAVGGLPLSVDTSGRVDVLKINGTSQTARDIGASVLLSSGTGTGQLDITSGVVKANWVQILGSAITGTASQLAAAVTKFFNVATPTGTVNSLPDAVPGASGGVVIAGSNAATTFATLTVTGAFSINGTSNVAQTGDSYARIGVNGVGLTNVTVGDYASGKAPLQPTTAGRTLDVSATGEAGIDWANIGSPTTTVNLSGTTIAAVSGAVGSISGVTFPTNFSVLSISATTGLVTFANTTIGVSGDFSATMKTSLNAATPSVTVSDKTGFSLSGTQTFNNTGTWTGNVSGNVTGSVNSVTTGVTLAASAVQAIWDALTSALTTTGSIGKSLVTFLGNFANMISGTGTGTPKFTTSALSNAPAGGGGGSGLSGPSSVTLTFVDASTNPVPLVEFTLLSEDKSTAIGSARADSNGVATFGTDDGSYYVTAQATSTVLFADAALSVSSTTAQTITGSSNIPAPSTTPSGCNVYDTAIGIDGAAKAGVEYHFRVTQAASGTRNGSEQTATSVGTGTNNIVMALTQGDTMAIKRGTAAQWETFTVPASTSAQLSDLLDEDAAVGKDGSTP